MMSRLEQLALVLAFAAITVGIYALTIVRPVDAGPLLAVGWGAIAVGLAIIVGLIVADSEVRS